MKNKIKIFGLFILVFTMLGIDSKQIRFNDTNVVNAADEVTNYYSSIDFNQTGLNLRSEVRDLITNTHKNYTTYSGLKDAFKTADADVNKNGNIIWFYSGTSVSFNGFGSGNGSTNREHVWPKNAGKAFDAQSNCGSDAHHLRPTEAQLNSTRSDNSFNEVATTQANIVRQNGSTKYENLCYTAGGFFYPGEGYRGATARILMYVQTRWGDKYNLRFVDSAGNNKTIGKISTLMKWHLTEPVTEEEKRRNEAVYKIQGNRNPFIDHPEIATKIYCNDGEVYNNALKKVAEEYDKYNPIEDDKVLESITLIGKANKASYNEGEKFDPTGLNVIGIYEDDSTKKIPLESCDFIDATTYSEFLSKGTTSVICIFDNKLATYNGIEVKDGAITHKCDFTNKDTLSIYLKEKATCLSKAKYYYSCKECKAKSNDTFEYGEILTSHTFDGTLKYDENIHYYKCNKCDAIKDLENHTFTWIIDKEATVRETGLKHEECSVCHYKQNENTVIEKLPHNHEFGKWNVVKEASTTEEGLEERICSICNEKETRSIAKLEENKGCKGNTSAFSFLFSLIIVLFILKKKYI